LRFESKPKPMKKIIPSIVALCSIVILLNSCAVGKNSVATQKTDPENTNETSACFVQLNDGSIKQYESLKLVTGVLTTPHLLADNKVVINSKDIMAYQNSNHYAVAAKILTSTKKSYVATETLPGFAVKVLSGKLNVYSRKYYNGANTVDEYFLQTGNDGYIVAYSKDVLKSMLKEDAKALEYLNSKSKKSPKSKLLTAVEMYNNSQMVTKN
jgi:hypothetical protein